MDESPLESGMGKRSLATVMMLWWCVASALTGRAEDAAAKEPQTAADSAAPESAPAQSCFVRWTNDSCFFLWTDTSLSVLPWGWRFEVDPSEQSTLTIEHAHVSAIGDLFMFLDLTKFHDAGSDFGTYYAEISPRLSVGKILHEDLSFSLFRRSLFEFKDVLLAGQYERGEDGDEAEAALLGIGFDLDVRDLGLLGLLGKFQYIQLNLYARAELSEDVNQGFEDMQVTMVAGYPFKVGPTRFLVDGYFDWVTGIGSENFSFHLNPQLKLDVGNFFGKPEKFYAGVELDFWWNKYQIQDTSAFDTDQEAISLLLKYHF